MKVWFCVLAALLLPLQAQAVGELYRVKADRTIGCLGPAAKDLSQAKGHPNEPLPKDCRLFKAGFQFSFQQLSPYSFDSEDRVNPGQIETTVYATWLDDKVEGGAEYATFDQRDVEAVLDATGQPVRSSCSAPIGGEYDRLEADKDGRLYLKRYELKAKCINGQMRTTSRPLN